MTFGYLNKRMMITTGWFYLFIQIWWDQYHKTVFKLNVSIFKGLLKKNCRGVRKYSHKWCESKKKFAQWELCESWVVQFIRKKTESQLWLEWVKTLAERSRGSQLPVVLSRKKQEDLETSAQTKRESKSTRRALSRHKWPQNGGSEVIAQWPGTRDRPDYLQNC